MRNKRIIAGLSVLICLFLIFAGCAETTQDIDSEVETYSSAQSEKESEKIETTEGKVSRETETESSSESEVEKEAETETASEIVDEDKTSEAAKEKEDAQTSVTMLDVGQGLSILLESNGEYALYDGGGRDYSSYVVSYLQKHDITHLKYMITSHYDEDHINGLIGVMNTTEIDLVIRPDYEHDSKLYQSYLTMLEKNGADSVFPSVGDTYTLGNATLEVLSPESYGDDANENSIVISVSDGEFNCIITGDAEKNSEKTMIDDDLLEDYDLYVAGHHGSSSSSSAAFVDVINPEYVFVSVGADNSYGHPTEKTMKTFENGEIQVFRSDIQDEVTCYTDGETYWFSEEPCNDYSAGGVDGTEYDTAEEERIEKNTEEKEDDATISYVLNTNSLKFHLADCRYAKQISDENREEFSGTREELIEKGYSACGVCNP